VPPGGCSVRWSVARSNAAYTKFAAAHAKYTALPEEADAWKIGLAVKAAVQKPAAAK
jgi:hypothetical protein